MIIIVIINTTIVAIITVHVMCGPGLDSDRAKCYWQVLNSFKAKCLQWLFQLMNVPLTRSFKQRYKLLEGTSLTVSIIIVIIIIMLFLLHYFFET